MLAQPFRIIVLLVACCFCFKSTHAECSRNETQPGPDGSVGNLDRHHVACPTDQLINRFGLIRPFKNQMAYEYTCCQPAELFQCYQKVTEVTAAGNVNYLDRQNIECDPGYLLQAHQMEQVGNGFRYRLDCCAASPENCATHKTEWNYDGMGNVIYLDRHDVSCPNDKILQQFGLETKGINMRYRYTCCEANLACPSPYDKVENVLTCDARHNSTTLCKYERKIGASSTDSSSEPVLEATSWGLEDAFLKFGISDTTEYDWSQEAPTTFQAERTKSASFACSAGHLCQLDQIVGYCGNNKYEIRSSAYRQSTN